MRKLAVVVLSLFLLTPQLSVFVVAQRDGSLGKKRLAVLKSEKKPERRPAVQSSSQPQPQPQRELAFQELASVIIEAQNLQDKADAFKVLAKSANLLWLRSPTKSTTMFLQLWQVAKEIEAVEVREDARTDILRYLVPRDSKLAAKLLEEASVSTNSRAVPISQLVKGSDPTSQRLNNLASKLVQQQDSIQAGTTLERALAVAVTPATVSTLTKLRQINVGLADSVVARTLERLKTRPTVLSLPGLYLLVDYVFPASNVDANARVNAPSQSLRALYFLTSYSVLKKSIQESDLLLSKEHGYSMNDLRFRSIFQNQLAGVLAELAPGFAPHLIPELKTLATERFASVSSEATAISRFTRKRLSDSQESSGDRFTDISVALAKGDIPEAERLLGGVEDETSRKAVAQTIARVAFGLALAKSELDEAHAEARKLEDPTVRAMAYAQLARAARAKGDKDFTKLIVSDALSLFSEGKSNGLRARALLMLAPEALALSGPDALDLLRRAATVINDLPAANNAESSESADLDDPLSLRDAPELQRAFSTIASADFEGTLLAARQIEPQLISLLARLATLETVLTRAKNNTKVSGLSLNHGESSFTLTPGFLQSGVRKSFGQFSHKSAIKAPPAPKQLATCSCGPCMVKSSLTATAPVPGRWWDCMSDCMRGFGVSAISVTLCGAACVTGNVPICAICFALHATAFNFCALYCAVHLVPPSPTYCDITGLVKTPPDGETGTNIAPRLIDCNLNYEPCLCRPRSPIIIDVAGNGFDLTNVADGVRFNITGFGPEPLGWTRADSDDAFLSLDLNANGSIDDGTELFGNFTYQPEPAPGAERNGFAALAVFDFNADGKIDSDDNVYSELRLWQDKNHNGVSEPEELKRLDKLGLKTLFLDYTRSGKVDRFGNEFRYRARVNDFGDRQLGRWAWDVFLVSLRPPRIFGEGDAGVARGVPASNSTRAARKAKPTE
jgi:hypothetical protein